MNNIECTDCHSTFRTQSSLSKHQKTAKYCQKIRDAHKTNKTNKNNYTLSTDQIVNLLSLSSRPDGYVDVFKLAPPNTVSEWIVSHSELIKDMEREKRVKAVGPVTKKMGSESLWIHPELAILFSQDVYPNFSLQMVKWIRTLLQQGKVVL
jgi:hypothetical protein